MNKKKSDIGTRNVPSDDCGNEQNVQQRLKEGSPVSVWLDNVFLDDDLSEFLPIFDGDGEAIYKDMVKNGWDSRFPMLVWKRDGRDILIDGHTRLSKAKKAGLMHGFALFCDFKSKDEAIEYMAHIQFSRRSSNDAATLFAVKKYLSLMEGSISGNLREHISKIFSVSNFRARQLLKVAREGNEEMHSKIFAGDITINIAFDSLKTKIDLPGSKDKLSDYKDFKADEEEKGKDKVFLSPEEFEEMVKTLEWKKNIILQGPPGVGKTFIARKVAYALMQQEDDGRILSVQFHQSYSYEDFLQGLRPVKEGGFEVANGVFYRICGKALKNPKEKYVLIIDEINRGNLGPIFGEALTLIESDKRSIEYGVSLPYHNTDSILFFVPSNVYLIGLMNTADRSLTMIDHAFRRRFAFMNLKPQFTSDGFTSFLSKKGVGEALGKFIIDAFENLNKIICKDTKNLGTGYEIGHSFFCNIPEDLTADSEKDWYNRIIRTEIAPLIREYWYEQPHKAEEISKELFCQ